ncbi:MAG: hypothetical protein AAGH15_11510 [Myxococcota bacterium]
MPEHSILGQDIAFDTQNKTGEDYSYTVRVRRSQGLTYNGGASYGTVFALNEARNGETREAKERGSEMVLRERVASGLLASAVNAGKQAYGNFATEIIQDMRNTMSFAREEDILYGGTNIGEISGIAGSGTSRVLTFTPGSWAPGLWAQKENAALDAYNPALTTQRNGNAAIIVGAIDNDARTVAVTGNAADLTALTVGDVVLPFGAVGNWFNGLDALVPSTGVLHGIDGAVYSLWRGNTRDNAGGAASLAILTSAAARTVVRSGATNLKAYVSTYTWTDLNNDSAAIRRYTSSTKEGLDLGTTKITYYGPNGTIDIVPHPMVKAGEAFMLSPRHLKRIGAADITNRQPGLAGAEENYLHVLENNMGYEMRMYSNQALFNCRPAAHVKITGIVNAAS